MFKNRKIPYLNLVPILLIAFILFRVVHNIEIFTKGLGIFISYISSFIWAFGIAYLLNPLMVFIEKRYPIKRPLTLLIIYTLVLGIIVFCITIVSPIICNSIGELVNSMPDYIYQTEIWISKNIDKFDVLDKYGIKDYVRNVTQNFILNLGHSINGGINIAVSTAINFTSSFVKFVFGFIVSVYMLKDKELFLSTTSKFTYAVFGEDRAKNIIHFTRQIDQIFSKYIIGKSLDSLIIGIICFIGLTILQIPYAALISLIVGITNMIPYFGPFIGMIPAVIITLFSSLVQALWVFIFILILQQFDGWYLGPKILGSSVGLNPLLIILAIIVGGSTFGVMGMFLGVPIMAVIKLISERFLEKKLSHNKQSS